MFRRVIEKRDEVELHLLGMSDLNSNLEKLEIEVEDPESSIAFHSLGQVKDSRPIANLIDYHMAIKSTVRKVRPDIYFAAHFDRGLPAHKVNTAVAIHDAIPLVTGKYSTKGWPFNSMKKLFYRHMWNKARKAKIVFTPSEYSKRDLIQVGGFEPEQIQVIHLGISEVFIDVESTITGKTQQQLIDKFFPGRQEYPAYLIYDAGFEANKNTDRLLEIFAKLHQQIPNLNLVVTGGDFKTIDGEVIPQNERGYRFWNLVKKSELMNCVIPVGRVSEQHLAELLYFAQVYINLSNYEGFGFGPLQAMAAGVPAVVSDSSCFPEISGPAATVLNPDNIDQTIPQIVDVLTKPNIREERIHRGKEYSQQFRWENTFEKTWKALMKLT